MRYLRLCCVALMVTAWCRMAVADEADSSQQEALVLAYGKAFHDSDHAAAKSLSHGTDAQYENQDRFITLAHSRENLYQQAVAKFGDDGKKVIDYRGDLGDWLMHQENWKIVPVGGSDKAMVVGKNSATIGATRGPKEPPKIISGGADLPKPVAAAPAEKEPVGSHVQLIKVEGQWKVDLARIEYIHESTTPYAPLVKVFDDVAVGIKDGKYATAADAKADAQQQTAVALKTRVGRRSGRTTPAPAKADPPAEKPAEK
jgi:hypothetical protein